jgi:hypothetical protein
MYEYRKKMFPMQELDTKAISLSQLYRFRALLFQPFEKGYSLSQKRTKSIATVNIPALLCGVYTRTLCSHKMKLLATEYTQR